MTKQSYIQLTTDDLKVIIENACGEPIKNIEVVTKEKETIPIVQLNARINREKSKNH